MPDDIENEVWVLHIKLYLHGSSFHWILTLKSFIVGLMLDDIEVFGVDLRINSISRALSILVVENPPKATITVHFIELFLVLEG